MKNLKTVLAASVAAASMTMAAAPASAELAASVGVASTYLWRGYDLGSGTPAVSGDISYSTGGAYIGAWASSGDTAAGTEYDLYAGYGMEFDGFSFDISVWNYNYPTGPGYLGTEETDFFEHTDVILTFGLGPVSFSYYEPIAGPDGFTEYNYYTLSTGFGAFSATLGMEDIDGDNSLHLDIAYAYNDNLSFIVSQQDGDVDELGLDTDPKFIVSYSLPIEM
ncbi:histidine kinase [Spongiibacter nanhainus]|uniref:Histidine kinase n=1 Tax=Spongiibacter nanhainus TaxID=2794344 RepID=A0A7T4R099_9GAMM|nr:TorF family putative porin [Spongiibacter nanhainus]QQD18070.1 histidine kinase [Spongiibacter nanhainus]